MITFMSKDDSKLKTATVKTVNFSPALKVESIFEFSIFERGRARLPAIYVNKKSAAESNSNKKLDRLCRSTYAILHEMASYNTVRD